MMDLNVVFISFNRIKGTDMNFKLRKITEKDDAAVAGLVRENLKKFGLDIPGTAYFDEGLDHLSRFYNSGVCQYYVAEAEGKIIGGIGFAPFETMEKTAELQKLYLTDSAKGSGIGYKLVAFIEEKMRESGFRKAYLETHENLQGAIHIYRKSGYHEIERPKEVGHSTMNRFFEKEL